MFISLENLMGMRALEGGLPKFGKNYRIFIFGNGVFTGKMPTFRQQIFFLGEQIFKYKLHILNLLCRAQCIAIHIDSDFFKICLCLTHCRVLPVWIGESSSTRKLVTLEGWVILPVKSH